MKLDTAFVETVERIDFDWPDSLAVKRTRTGVAEIVGAMLLSAGLVVFAQRAIAVLYSAIASSKKADVTPHNQPKGKE
jgi:hypothetical protein